MTHAKKKVIKQKAKTNKKKITQQKTKKDKKYTRSNLVIGLTGPFGSGCGEMRQVLESLGFRPFKFSDDIRAELRKTKKLIDKGKKDWRKVLQDRGNKRREKDRAYWIKKVIERIDATDVGDGNIVIDGFRNFQEVQEIRKVYPRFFLVAICADKDERWKRVLSDYKGRYNEFERDDRRDRSEDIDWGQSVQKCVDDADYVYYNNEHLVVNQQGNEAPNLSQIKRILKSQAEDFIPLMQGMDTCRGPNPEEVQMAAAYAQSNSSTCRKRHVGAVITISRDGQELPISMGFNENPPGIPTCFKEGACYKDENMEAKLSALKNIYCPLCGKKQKALRKPWLCECGTSFQQWLYRNRNMELCPAIHAEERAISSLGDRSAREGTLYVTTFPCFRCARLILDIGITKVVFVEAYPVAETARFLIENGVKVEPFSGFTARSFFTVFPKVS